MIMSGNEAGTSTFSDADGRSTETEQRSRCPTDCCKWLVRRLYTVRRTAPAVLEHCEPQNASGGRDYWNRGSLQSICAGGDVKTQQGSSAQSIACVTALCDPWDASCPTAQITGTKCIWSPTAFTTGFHFLH